MNALDSRLMTELLQCCRELEDDADVRVVLLRGAGDRAFSVGADLKERQGLDVHATRLLRARLVKSYRAVNRLPMPTVAAVHGWVLGGGFELAMCCDLIVAADNSTFGLPEVSLGIMPGGGGTQLLPRLIGASKAKLLIYTARRFHAVQAAELGIVAEVVRRSDLDEAARALAAEIAANAPISLRQAKRAIDLGAQLDLESAFALEAEVYNTTLLSEDRLEGLRAFAEKRMPTYRGR
ncbi:MAG: enoyl-CoA hydratase/isomerase family protein [Chloroflexi bacterium]|nr:enoyl-CoA hydratase/isomerase family protein [Chloroflexota bacterium]